MKVASTLFALTAIALGVPLVYTLAAGRFAGEAAPAPVGRIATVSDDVPDPGAVIYARLCRACHGSGAAGAPPLGSKEAWSPRIAQGMDSLLQSVIHGKGAMPPRGTCGDCSDRDLGAAIAYMISCAQ
jgi:cytochrome c5